MIIPTYYLLVPWIILYAYPPFNRQRLIAFEEADSSSNKAHLPWLLPQAVSVRATDGKQVYQQQDRRWTSAQSAGYQPRPTTSIRTARSEGRLVREMFTGQKH